MAWRIEKKFGCLNEALNYFKTEYVGINYDVRGKQIHFTKYNFPHFINLDYGGETRSAILVPKIENRKITNKNSKFDMYRLRHLPSIKTLYKNPDEIWRDFKDAECIHYIKNITSIKTEKLQAHTLVAKWDRKGYYYPVSSYPVRAGYLKKIKSTALLWTKSGENKVSSGLTPPQSYKEDSPLPEKKSS